MGSGTLMFGVFTVVIMVVSVLIFGFCLAMFFSPKLRGKMMSNNVKAVRHMMDESEEDIHVITSKGARATSDAVTTTVKAIKKGIVEDDE